MIIKGLFRRYERWNPVHPTSGVFWGMGIGIGCGIGWGPGFGPEVIGYVGAGCGVGFSVGITLAGFGIGLPANWLFEVPYNALMATKSSMMELARSRGLVSTKNYVEGWNNIASQISCLERDVNARFSNINHKQVLDQGLDNMKSTMSIHTRSVLECVQICGRRFFRHHKGDS